MNVTFWSIIAGWFVRALLASFSGAVENAPSAILLSASFILALTAYLCLYFGLPSFRHFVLHRSVRSLTLAETPRITGFIFLIGYAQGVLPALYASQQQPATWPSDSPRYGSLGHLRPALLPGGGSCGIVPPSWG